jgi:hypothetical protein
MTPADALTALAVAVAAGGLIGAEREQAHGVTHRDFGGVRTFPLLAMVGVIGGLLRPTLGAWIVGALLLAVVVALGVAQARAKADDIGVSSEVAAIVTFGLGVMSATPELMPKGSRYLVVLGIAAVTMALLALKRPLHGFIAKVSSDDVYATVKFVLLALGSWRGSSAGSSPRRRSLSRSPGAPRRSRGSRHFRPLASWQAAPRCSRASS